MSLDEKISALPVYITPIATDFFPIVDITTGITKRIDFSLVGGGTLTPWTENIDGADFALLNFGFIESGSANVATAEVIRLANNDRMSWRNAANSSNQDFYLSTNDKFIFESPIRASHFEAGGIVPTGGSGGVRFGFDKSIVWRNVGDTDDYLLTLNTAGTQRIRFGTAASPKNIVVSDSLDTLTNKTWGDDLDMDNNNIIIGTGQVQFGAGESIGIETNDMVFDVTTGDIFSFDIDGTPEVSIDSSGLDLRSNTLDWSTEGHSIKPIGNTLFLNTDLITDAFVVACGGSVVMSTTFAQISVFAPFVMNGRSITSIDDLIFSNSTGILKWNTGETITMQSGHMFFDVTITEGFSWDIDGTPEMTLNVTELDLKGKVLQFNVGERIGMENNDMVFDVSTTDDFDFQISGVTEMLLNIAKLDIDAKYLEIESIASPGVTGSATIGRVFMDSGNSNELSIIRNGSVISLEGGGGGSQTPWTSDIDASQFDLQDLGNIEFGQTTGIPAGTIPAIYVNANDMIFNVATTRDFQFKVNDVLEMTLSATALDLQNNDLSQVDNITSGGDNVHNWDISRDATLADDTEIGSLRFRAFDGSSSLDTYARIEGILQDDSGGLEDGSLHFYATRSGGEEEFLSINATSNTISVLKTLDIK